jgi:hypothetical protein
MKFAALMLALFALGGCASSPPPVPEKHQLVRQDKALAAQHWGAIAADVASRTKNTLATRDFLYGRSLYVAPASRAAFDIAFTNFMITALVEAGVPVSSKPDGAVEIKYETQLIQHKVEFDPRKEGYVPGAPENVAANFWVQRNVTVQEPKAMALGEASTRAHMWPTSAELVVTTSIEDVDQYQQRTTDAYYVENADIELFKSKEIERSYKQWKVVSE